VNSHRNSYAPRADNGHQYARSHVAGKLICRCINSAWILSLKNEVRNLETEKDPNEKVRSCGKSLRDVQA
jgi:hypothetical protein